MYVLAQSARFALVRRFVYCAASLLLGGLAAVVATRIRRSRERANRTCG